MVGSTRRRHPPGVPESAADWAVCYNPAAKDYFRWADAPALHETETDEGFSLEDLLQHIGRLELTALGYVEHGDVPPGEGA